MIDDIRDFYLNPIAPIAPIVEEPIEEAVSLDEIDAPENIEDEPSIEDEALTIEYDDSLADDSDDFHEEVE